jgi:hypothetical protein
MGNIHEMDAALGHGAGIFGDNESGSGYACQRLRVVCRLGFAMEIVLCPRNIFPGISSENLMASVA